MNQPQSSTRPRNALTAGAAAYLTLLLIGIWICGPSFFLLDSFGFTLLFLAISLCAALIEACFPPVRTKRTVIIGICTSLASGFAIVLYIVSNI